MEEVIPFLLVLLSWHSADPKASMTVEQRLEISEQACKAEGSEFVAQRDIYAEEFKGMAFSYACLRAPDQDDFRTMFERAQ